MNLLAENSCPTCYSENIESHTTYTIQSGEERTIHYCRACQDYFSETKNTPLAGLRTPLSRITEVIEALNDGLGINAAARTFKVAKNTIYDWLERVAGLKEVLLLYALCHQFLSQIVEGDELYPAGLRRKLSCFRRRTNTYAKQEATLQIRLDVHWVLHNFVRPHFTTKQVPAFALGILDQAVSLADLFKVRYI